MRPETRFILATALFVNSCAPLVAHAEESPDDSKSHVVVPTATLIPPTPTFYNFDIPSTSTIEPVITQTPETLFANSCILPFEGALMEGGLQFLDVIENEGGGRIHRHLGLDFKGGVEGQTVVNMCDGIVVYSGPVKQGTGKNLGNIVDMKYTYMENDVLVNVYMRYAHMKDLSNLEPGQILKMGERLGLISHSGGWRADQDHLHIDIMKEETFNEIVVARSRGDLKNEIGYYALAELWDKGMIADRFIDPKKWISERLQK